MIVSIAVVAQFPATPLVYATLILLALGGIAFLLIAARRATSATLTTVSPQAGDHAGPGAAMGPAEDAILRFTREVTKPVPFDQLQVLIARQLPALLGAERAWIVARFDGRQRLILPGTQQDTDDKRDPLFGNDRADWTTFPLMSGKQMVGVLGVDVTGRKLSDEAVTVVRAVGPIIAHALVTADATDRLRESSILDPLTGCSTRPHGLERLTVELKRAGRSSTPVAVLMVDLDYFKSVNDRFGHSAGDAVLTTVGRTMLETLRASDVRSRWGGEEFLIVLPETALEPARQVAESLLRRIAEVPVHTSSGTIRVTASIGLTVARAGEEDVEALIARADRALYRAKADGRGCVRIVLGDFKGAPIGVSQGSQPLPFRERRDPNRPDRRRIQGPGRRKTDVWPVTGASHDADAAIPRRAADRATRH